MRRYIADLHFDDDIVNKLMDKRGFETVDEMNEYMIIIIDNEGNKIPSEFFRSNTYEGAF